MREHYCNADEQLLQIKLYHVHMDVTIKIPMLNLHIMMRGIAHLISVQTHSSHELACTSSALHATGQPQMQKRLISKVYSY